MILRANIKQWFFDRKAVINATDAGNRRVLSKFGAFVRTRAKSSIRKRKGVSAPGRPPHSHVGLLKKLIYFAFDPARKSVVIGPTLANSASSNISPIGKTVPETLEEGGVVLISRRFNVSGKKRRAYLRARPYMKPAADEEMKNLPRLYANSIK